MSTNGAWKFLFLFEQIRGNNATFVTTATTWDCTCKRLPAATMRYLLLTYFAVFLFSLGIETKFQLQNLFSFNVE